MVLGGGKKPGAGSIAKRMQRKLDAVEQFLNDNPRAGRAKRSANHHFLDRLPGFGEGMTDDNPFAKGQTIRFNGTLAFKCAGKGLGGCGVAESGGSSRRNAVSGHEILREYLRGFKLGSGLVGTPNPQPVLLEEINHPHG
jgi:hypothetical protein